MNYMDKEEFIEYHQLVEELRSTVAEKWASVSEEDRQAMIKIIDDNLKLSSKGVEWLDGFFHGSIRFMAYSFSSNPAVKFLVAKSPYFMTMLMILGYTDRLINQKMNKWLEEDD